ncbi:MAG: 2-phospho-L-lactate guanylyltransferase [Elusimicrobia bacterium]|nr:2-phospho-L-lactate guanylyltransferase [Elusimicrobiota bacterium]
MPHTNLLVIFVKAPIPGQVKTRLMPHLNGTECAELYTCFVKDILNTVSQLVNTKILVAYQPHAPYPDLAWTGLKKSFDTLSQQGKTLGERLAHATGLSFGRGAKRVVIIGSDAPNFPLAHVTQAFDLLHKCDVVLGPALDGGYTLIGLSRPTLKLFENINWSTDQVYDQTLQQAANLGLALKVLPTHYDVDTFQELLQLKNDLSTTPHAAPLTFDYLTHALSVPF